MNERPGKSNIYIKRTICIILILALIICGLFFFSNLLQEKHRSMQVDTFYDLPENSVDVLFVGSSRTVRAISPNILYDQIGISSYSRSSELLSAQNQYLYLLDSFKTQSPKVVFLSAPRLQNGYNEDRDMHYHFGMAKVNFSIDKLKVAMEYEKESTNMKALDMMLPVFKYHYRWNQLGYRDFFTYSNINTRGQDPYWRVYDFDENEKDLSGRIDPDADTEVTFDPIVKKYLDKSIEYCKEQGAEVVIYSTPANTWNNEKYAAVEALAKEHNIRALDCNLDEILEQIDDDLWTNWQDNHEHYNGWGAYALTSFVSSYIDEEFDLTDYRGKNGTTANSLSEAYEQYYKRYQMFLPQELSKPDGYDSDNIKKMKALPTVKKDTSSAGVKYKEFENKLAKADLEFSWEWIDVSEVKGISGKRYELTDGICALLIEYEYGTFGHSLTSHKRVLDFDDAGSFPLIDPVSHSGFVMAFDGTSTKDQAILLTDIYEEIK